MADGFTAAVKVTVFSFQYVLLATFTVMVAEPAATPLTVRVVPEMLPVATEEFDCADTLKLPGLELLLLMVAVVLFPAIIVAEAGL